MKKQQKSIKKLLESFDIEIENESDEPEFYRLKINDCFLFLEKENNNIHISFNASARPDYSAYIISLIKNQLKDINRVYVSDLYYNTQDKNYFGESAYNKYIEEMFEVAVSDYCKYVYEANMLKNFESNQIN